MKKNEPPIVLKQEFQCSQESLWRAITEPKQMRLWYFDNIPDFKARVGFKVEFLIRNEGRTFTHQWEVLEVVPNKCLSYHWRYKEYPGEAVIHFTLERSAPVMLVVTMDVLTDFPDGVPEFERSSCVGGWNYFIKESLVDYFSQPSISLS